MIVDILIDFRISKAGKYEERFKVKFERFYIPLGLHEVTNFMTHN